MTCIILQCRLDSTRLSKKALLDLAGRPVIVRVMENLRRVSADAYVLACDTDSESILAPLASSCAFTCISGPKEDVLERFCIAIRHTGAQTVLRATGDNPFLFSDAAEASLYRFNELQTPLGGVDYFTYAGLPHGSGIEVFSAKSLLEAAALSDSPFDHEHVGPALYNHTDRFICVRETPPTVWYHPEMRTTIDTSEDYERACLMAEHITSLGVSLPCSTRVTIDSFLYVSRPLVFIPSVARGQGTGHFRRLVSLISSLRNEWRCLLYIPRGSLFLSQIPEDIKSLVIEELPETAHMIILDRFRSSAPEVEKFRKIAPVVALDEGGTGRTNVDYLLDILPGLTNTFCKANLASLSYISLPEKRKTKKPASIETVLVLAGGENAAGLALPTARILADMALTVTVIDPAYLGNTKKENSLTISGSLTNLRERLFEFDLVVTHYGFTAFEALAAGCSVILFSPSAYHYRLSKAYGFSAIPQGKPSALALKRILSEGILVPSIITSETVSADLASEIAHLATHTSCACPLCGNSATSRVVERFSTRTIRRCLECDMVYQSFVLCEDQPYERSYFFDDYKAQYGKTYLEDFESIKSKGSERISVINRLVKKTFRYLDNDEKQLLDIGCAYGPFLVAAQEGSWHVTGTDICEDAVRYVRDVLHIPSFVSAFPAPDATNTVAKNQFAVITLWYVIEHFTDLEPVFQRIRDLMIPGGVLSFSTPSASGVSARFNRHSFYQNSPLDHYTLWDQRKVKKQLARYGFSVVKIISTGHHPERFPLMKDSRPGSLSWRLCNALSRLFSLGDTFEVYAVKKGFLEDVK